MALFEFTCDKGHVFTFSFPGCRVCPVIECESTGISKPVPESKVENLQKDITNQVKEDVSVRSRFLAHLSSLMGE